MSTTLRLLFSFFLSIALFNTSATTTFPEDVNILEAYLDGVIETHMKEKNIAGASLSLVKDGETILKKGYGYADVERKTEVDPEVTLFRLGSVSKLFTWLAVLQQVEQGNLNLDADINDYLEAFSIPETFEQPITLRSLMSHTPGFEDILLEIFVRDAEEMLPLEELFQRQMPKRVRPPLEVASYSNHGTGLAQYLVEKVSGLPFEEYVEEKILKPLGMMCTTFRQPLPEEKMVFLSKGYSFRDGIFREGDFEYVPMTGAGGASASAADMVVFMKAMLNNTCIDTICLMEPATYDIMAEPVLFHAPEMNPALHGYMDLSRNNHRIIGHGGDTFLFHTLMLLIPEENFGFFLSFNSEAGAGTYSKVFEQFLDRFFPDPRELMDTITLDDDYLEGFTGSYKANRHPHTDILKILSLAMAAEVSTDNGRLRLSDGFTGETSFWLPVDSLTFRNENSNELMAFEREGTDRAGKLYFGQWPIMAFERMRGGYSIGWNLFVIVLSLLCVLFILIGWPLLYLLRRNYVKALHARNPLPTGTKLLAWICALFLALFYLFIFIGFSGGTDIVFGVPGIIKIGVVFPFLSILFLLGMIWQSLVIWQTRDLRIRSRLFYNLATFAFILAIWQINFWNFLGWNF